MTEITPHISPYMDLVVTSVEFRYLETDPAQVQLVIRGELPDQCKYDFYSVENRGDQSVRISLKAIHLPETNCEQSRQLIEYELLLGRDWPEGQRGFAPGDYRLTVNNYETVFTIKQ